MGYLMGPTRWGQARLSGLTREFLSVMKDYWFPQADRVRRPMNIQHAQGFLEAIALANDATDHNCSFELIRLPDSDSILEALRGYFGAFTDQLRPPQHPDAWNISIEPLRELGPMRVEAASMQWFFDRGASSWYQAEWVKENIVRSFMFALKQSLGTCEVYRVQVTPPGFWYETDWVDFAFTSASGHHLLHFGFSDCYHERRERARD